MNPFLSVIIPIYNAVPYLRRCLDSILRQSFSDYELILVDDGSTDASFSVCEQYAQRDARIRLYHKTNGGVASARNFGLEQALGEYVCWVDADDTVSCDYLAHLANSAQEGSDLIIHSLVRIENNEQRIVRGTASGRYDLSSTTGQTAFFAAVNLDHFGVSFSKAFRSSIIRYHSLTYSCNICLAEDLDFLFRYLCHCQHVLVTDYADYNYIIRNGSVSTTLCEFDIESRGLHQISASATLLCDFFPIPQAELLRDHTIAAYIHRMLISAYKPQYDWSQRRSFFRNFMPADVQTYSQYGPHQTFFLRLMNSLFVRHHYLLFDVLMLFVYRLRYPLS